MGVLETPGMTQRIHFPAPATASLAARDVGVGDFLGDSAVEGAEALVVVESELASVTAREVSSCGLKGGCHDAVLVSADRARLTVADALATAPNISFASASVAYSRSESDIALRAQSISIATTSSGSVGDPLRFFSSDHSGSADPYSFCAAVST